ncbi:MULTISPECIES: hypothetical protein [Jonquetella]|uniref:POTRA domain-containing protein n=1 Tax=Jonquetella anthropi DSM 22815 TaxID=885272 RepID=H0ULD2_9BACT|nr:MULTISPECIES: hypothetical protein [Jonquetella]EEX48053.1 hypothetical protein GCWU000246_01371 [Jonquetella anthropi E3_33 E1]EHM13491.1 hypothetical protein JonanDRAFT_1124 [Jonquetella anthropi DSM 22815]ERL24388.1 hypothetical protein HMPREF1249_1606 [Jonquetella sp. BV3C21]
MNWRGVAALLLALGSGALMKVGELYEPFRLRSLIVRNGTPATEAQIHAWSESFSFFGPMWCFHWDQMREWEDGLPVHLTVSSSHMGQSIEVFVESLSPAIELIWHGENLFLAEDGHIWTKKLSDQYMLGSPQGLPALHIDDSFPVSVLSTDGTLEHMGKSDLSAQWVRDLLAHLSGMPDMTASNIVLRRRGGEDVVQCFLTSRTKGTSISFLGSLPYLDKTLPVAHRLLLDGATKGYSLFDATYKDKVILRQLDSSFE